MLQTKRSTVDELVIQALCDSVAELEEETRAYRELAHEAMAALADQNLRLSTLDETVVSLREELRRYVRAGIES